MKDQRKDIITPFDWRRFVAPGAEASQARDSSAQTRAKSRRAKKLTVGERIARIMAPRWGNPYCKPGAP